MSNQKSFMFYLNWEEQLSVLSSDEERWNFVHNLIKFHRGEELEFKTDMVKLIWLGVKIAVEENQRKWNERANNSRINGKKNTGNKNHDFDFRTQQVISEPTEPVKSKESIVKSEELIVNGKVENVNSEILNINSQQSNNSKKSTNTGMSEFDYFSNQVSLIEKKILSSYNNADAIIMNATTDNLRDFIDNKKQYDELFPLIKNYREYLKFLSR